MKPLEIPAIRAKGEKEIVIIGQKKNAIRGITIIIAISTHGLEPPLKYLNKDPAVPSNAKRVKVKRFTLLRVAIERAIESQLELAIEIEAKPKPRPRWRIAVPTVGLLKKKRRNKANKE